MSERDGKVAFITGASRGVGACDVADPGQVRDAVATGVMLTMSLGPMGEESAG